MTIDMQNKLQQLLRYHRQRVFEAAGHLHTRALYRLKRTQTFRAMAKANDYAGMVRQGDRLARMGY